MNGRRHQDIVLAVILALLALLVLVPLGLALRAG